MEIQDELLELRIRLGRIQAQLAELLARPQEKPLPRLVPSKTVMKMLGYSATAPMLKAAEKAGCPMIHINSRRILFDLVDVSAWLQRLKEAEPEMRVRIESGSPLQQRRRKAGRV